MLVLQCAAGGFLLLMGLPFLLFWQAVKNPKPLRRALAIALYLFGCGLIGFFSYLAHRPGDIAVLLFASVMLAAVYELRMWLIDVLYSDIRSGSQPAPPPKPAAPSPDPATGDGRHP
ncbi:MAG: hypothetical protein JWM33_2177 [Caulobacteraceae bacterium]|nr:hypothetical protein [Caulobacteraceae bacterium]